MTQALQETRILAVDPGKARIGLAVSDALGISLTPLGVVGAGPAAPDAIASAAKQANAGVVVIGWPVNMDGTEGKSALDARRLAGRVAKALFPIPVFLYDERLTSCEATDILEKAGRKPGRRKHEVDVMSAKLILRAFIDARRRGDVLKPIEPDNDRT